LARKLRLNAVNIGDQMHTFHAHNVNLFCGSAAAAVAGEYCPPHLALPTS
jgi:hypothetical protein